MTETVVVVAVAVIVAVTASDETIGRHIHLGGPNPPPQNFTGEVRVPLQLSTFPY